MAPLMPRGLLLPASLICLIAWAPAATRQDKPDFSGTWILDAARSSAPDVPRALTITMHLVSTTKRGEPMKPFFKSMDVRREFANRTTEETYPLGILGGSMGAPGSRASVTTRYRNVWEEETLVLELETETGPATEIRAWTKHREAWSFDTEGGLRIEMADSSSTSQPSTAALVYRRKSN